MAENSPETAQKPAEPVLRKDARQKDGIPWWQWFFLYPTFGLAFLTAVPDWADKAREIYLDIRGVSYDEAKEQQAFMRRNWKCTQTPHRWVETAVQTSVDGTICPETGDVFLRIMSPDNKVYLKGITVAKLFNDQRADASGGLISAAYASTSPRFDPVTHAKPGPRKRLRMAQNLAITICQRWLDDRKFVKRVQVNGQCHDEVYDSYTGERVSSQPASCSADC